MPNVVLACCILHDMCEIHKEESDNEWLIESQQQSQCFIQPTSASHQSSETDPSMIREKLVDYLFQ